MFCFKKIINNEARLNNLKSQTLKHKESFLYSCKKSTGSTFTKNNTVRSPVIHISDLSLLEYSVYTLSRSLTHTCTHTYVQSVKKKKNIPINFNTNNRRDMKLVPINLDYCLLQFDALKYFVGVQLHGGGATPNFNAKPQIFERNH